MKTIQFKRLAALAVALLATLITARGQIYVSVNNGFDGDAAVGEWNLNGTLVGQSAGIDVGNGFPKRYGSVWR
jgi:hypothetical protein